MLSHKAAAQLMGLGAAQTQGQPQLLLPSHFSGMLSNLGSLGQQELQVILQQQQTLQQQLQHFMLQTAAANASPTTASQLPQSPYFLSNQVNKN